MPNCRKLKYTPFFIILSLTLFIFFLNNKITSVKAITQCEVEGGRCVLNSWVCSGGSNLNLSCNSGYKCYYGGSCAAPTATPAPTYTCNGTCFPNGEDCYQVGSGTCPVYKFCCLRANPPTPTATPRPYATPTACLSPLVPTGLTPSGTLSCGQTSVTLNWNASSGATKYALRVDDLSNGWTGTCSTVNPGDTCTDSVTTNSYTRGITPGKTYTWWVHAINSCGWSQPSYATFASPVCPSPTPYPGWACNNNYAGKCVSASLICNPSQIYPADCPANQKCVHETATCAAATPTPTRAPTATPTPPGWVCYNNYAGKCVNDNLICNPSVVYPAVCPTGQKCVHETAVCALPSPTPSPVPTGVQIYCSLQKLTGCLYGCKPDVYGGTCYSTPPSDPFCSLARQADCLFRYPPAGCELDVFGGHCVPLYMTKTECIIQCLDRGNTPAECNAACANYTEPPSTCTERTIVKCASYNFPAACQPDPFGGHCVITNPIKFDAEVCFSNTECISGRCKHADGLNKSICVPAMECTPGMKIEKSSNPGDCTDICTNIGRWKVDLNDCAPAFPTYKRYCEGNTVVQEEIRTGIRMHGEVCTAYCRWGACTTDIQVSCKPGEYSYVYGSCSGIKGCPNSAMNFDGNCLAKCNSSGEWEVAKGCGVVSIDPNFSNAERYDILTTISKLEGIYLTTAEKLNFIRVPRLFIRFLLCGLYNAPPDNEILIADCGTNRGAYLHEFLHYIQWNKPDVFKSYIDTVECKQDALRSEIYRFTKEQPVGMYASINCREAMSEAGRMFEEDPCKLKTEFPIQYNWVKNNLFGGKDNCTVGFDNQTAKEQIAIVKHEVNTVNESQSKELVDKIKDKFNLISNVQAQTLTVYSGRFKIGSTLTDVRSELGNPSQVIYEYGLTILLYNTNDPSFSKVFIFNVSGNLIYFRLNPESLKAEYKTYDGWRSVYSQLNASVASNVGHDSTRYIYSGLGFSVVVDSTNKVVQYEEFVPITLDEYLDVWGNEIDRGKLVFPSSLQGDANGDGRVDGYDYVIWWQNFGRNVGGGPAQGDFNSSGFVDGYDYVIWWMNFGR